MHPPYPHLVRNQQLWLSNERCIFWENQQLLILSDTHFGKSGHFRKEGIGIPQQIYEEDIKRLTGVIQYFQPQGIFIIGDLFHSSFNKEINYFKKFRNDLAEVEFYLITGNHDILSEEMYNNLKINIYEKQFDLFPFSFVHDANDITEPKEHYFFCGHLHPVIELKGTAKQKLRLPCFHFRENYAYLPAFSKFTGSGKIQIKKNDQVFVITDEEIIPY